MAFFYVRFVKFAKRCIFIKFYFFFLFFNPLCECSKVITVKKLLQFTNQAKTIIRNFFFKLDKYLFDLKFWNYFWWKNCFKRIWQVYWMLNVWIPFIGIILATSFDVLELSLVSFPEKRVDKSHRILTFGHFPEVIHIELNKKKSDLA